MEQRNVLSAGQMVDLGGAYLLPTNIIASTGMLVYANNLNPIQSSNGNPVDLGSHHPGYDGSSRFRTQYNSMQIHHNVPDYDFVNTAPSNFYNPYIIPPISGRDLSFPQSSLYADQLPCAMYNPSIATNTNQSHRVSSLCFGSSRRSCKRKIVLSGNYSRCTGLSNLLPSHQYGSSEILQCDGAASMIEHPASCVSPTTLISHRPVRYKPGAFGLQPESGMFRHYKSMLQGSNTGVPYPPASHEWMVQSASIFGDGRASTWNNVNPVNFASGRCTNSESFEMTNSGIQGYLPSYSMNTEFPWHPACLSNLGYPLVPRENIHAHGHDLNVQISTSYGHPCSNFCHNPNPSLLGENSDSRFSGFPSSSEMIFRPHRVQPQPSLDASHGYLRSLPEDAALLEIRPINGVQNFGDQHMDMRLDIDGMSYEELLALEEKIGDVCLGSTEESITENLRINLYSLDTKFLDNNSQQQNESCVVCQIGYVENEKIGTLDCGHYYHVDCIKKWLLVKNLCPICKEAALSGNRKEMSVK